MIEFIEKDGELFRKVEPYPLTKEIGKLSIVRFIKDNSPMGRYNKEMCFEYMFRVDKSLQWDKRDSRYVRFNGTSVHHTRLEVIAEYCPEGGVYWAANQLAQGKEVGQIYKYKLLMTEVYRRLGSRWKKAYTSLDEFVKANQHTTDWKICEPEPTHGDITGVELKPTLIVGHWYVLNNCLYLQYLHSTNYSGELHTFRRAGEKYGLQYIREDTLSPVYHGSTLEPDFSNAKEGDEAWHYLHGKVFIERRTDTGDYPVKLLNESASWFTLKGKYWSEDTHPTIFHSFEHFLAYHREAEYQRKLGGDK